MFTASRYCLLYFIFILLSFKNCRGEPAPPPPPSLALWSAESPPHLAVLVRRAGEPLALRCRLHGAPPPRRYVWNYLPDAEDAVHEPLRGEPPDDGGGGEVLRRASLRVQDTGTYICSAPPLSAHKYILVQPRGLGNSCARGALSCGNHCVLSSYVCDGHTDCKGGEDEAPSLCGPTPPCAAPDRLNCSSGRCIPAAACCRASPASPAPLCRQPHCCEEHPAYWRQDGFDADFPPLFVDRHPPDDYSFIQSTIYTVTACALIFMIAVVLLVSAICKLHMKRAAARSRPLQYQARFPPCYEASRLLEQRLRPAPASSAPSSPCRLPSGADARPLDVEEPRGLQRLAALFNARYTQVPSQCAEVELQPLGSTPRPLHSPQHPSAGPRPLTLQLGRFRLSLPRLRGPDGPDGPDRPDRPDTPTVAEIDIEELDFVRLTSHETYTLNGRTIRLLGGEFESYPPPYNKLYGPPPRYPNGGQSGEPPPRYEDLAQGEGSNAGTSGTCNTSYGNAGNSTGTCNTSYGNAGNSTGTCNTSYGNSDNNTGTCNTSYGNSGNGTDTCNTSYGNAVNSTDTCSTSYGTTENAESYTATAAANDIDNGNDCGAEGATGNGLYSYGEIYNVTATDNGVGYEVAVPTDAMGNDVAPVDENTVISYSTDSAIANRIPNTVTECNGNLRLSAVIDNLPAIDSDVNANDTGNAICNGISVVVDNGN